MRYQRVSTDENSSRISIIIIIGKYIEQGYVWALRLGGVILRGEARWAFATV